MINVGAKNRHILKKLLRIKLEKFIDSLPQKMIYNFSQEKPFYDIKLTISSDEFELECIKEENNNLRKRILRLEAKNENDATSTSRWI